LFVIVNRKVLAGKIPGENRKERIDFPPNQLGKYRGRGEIFEIVSYLP